MYIINSSGKVENDEMVVLHKTKYNNYEVSAILCHKNNTEEFSNERFLSRNGEEQTNI